MMHFTLCTELSPPQIAENTKNCLCHWQKPAAGQLDPILNQGILQARRCCEFRKLQNSPNWRDPQCRKRQAQTVLDGGIVEDLSAARCQDRAAPLPASPRGSRSWQIAPARMCCPQTMLDFLGGSRNCCCSVCLES